MLDFQLKTNSELGKRMRHTGSQLHPTTVYFNQAAAEALTLSVDGEGWETTLSGEIDRIWTRYRNLCWNWKVGWKLQMFWGLSKGSFIGALMVPLRCGIEGELIDLTEGK
jgi:hypothetical protein